MPPPSKKIGKKYFLGKYYVKFGNFVNFSYIFLGNRNEVPVSGCDSYALLLLVHYSRHAHKFLSFHRRPVHASVHCSGVDPWGSVFSPLNVLAFL